MKPRPLLALTLLALARVVGAQGLHPVSHANEGLPVDAAPRAMYAREVEHPLNKLHALLFLAEVLPTEVGASLPTEREREKLSDSEFFTGRWYFRDREDKEITEQDRALFGGDVRTSPVFLIDHERGAKLRELLALIDTRAEVEAMESLRSPLPRVLLQWDLLSVWWRLEKACKQTGPPAAEPETLAALAQTIRALALPRSVLERLDAGTDALAPTGDGVNRTLPYVPPALLDGPRGAWREIARDEKELFHATNQLRAARVFVRARTAQETERLVALSAAATDDATTPRLAIGTEAALVLSLVVLDDALEPCATNVVDEVRVRRVTGPAELHPDNGSSRDGLSHWIYLLSRAGAVLGDGPRFRFVPDTAQGLFLEYGSPKRTTYFAQCALCHRRTNAGGQDPDGIRALGRYGKPSIERDPATRLRIAERQFAPAVESLRARLGLEPKRQ